MAVDVGLVTVDGKPHIRVVGDDPTAKGNELTMLPSRTMDLLNVVDNSEHGNGRCLRKCQGVVERHDSSRCVVSK